MQNEQTKKISWEVLVFILSFAFLLTLRLALAEGILKSSFKISSSNTQSSSVTVIAGGYHTCASLSSGSLKCWGMNGESQLGDNSQTDSETPVTVYGF